MRINYMSNFTVNLYWSYWFQMQMDFQKPKTDSSLRVVVCVVVVTRGSQVQSQDIQEKKRKQHHCVKCVQLHCKLICKYFLIKST